MAQWNPQVNDLFLKAMELASPEQRRAFLDDACAGDADLRVKVEAMLQAGAQAGSFLERPAALGETADESASATPPGAAPKQACAVEHAGLVLGGRYKLLEPIGEGGMGSVWMAQQTEPVKRLVAVKLIKAGMDSKQVLARFEAERQALALMDHPSIARVFDGGSTPDGRPFFVMELVKGVPITKYCDEQRLTPRARLELFAPVCHAIQHAHQKGVIHRDIKPNNVLVALYDDRPVPKVIDFGVAKATGQQLSEHSLHTGFGAVVGTVEYMSPEQASFNQLDVDTRSDIYSLGVLLYELLAGSPPFTRKELEKAGVLEMLRVIRELEPSKPSAKLSTADGLPALAAKRGTDPAKLTKLMRGELDWIVMKALEKDRSRRYETANGFAADVQRYLADEPVQACPPSAGYRLRKFVRRNRRGLTMAAMLAAAVLAIAGTLGWALRDRDARAEDQAREAARRLDQTEQGVRQALKQGEKLRAELHAELKDKGTRTLLNQPARWLALIKTAQTELASAQVLAAGVEGALDAELTAHLQQLVQALAGDEADYSLALRLEKIRLDKSARVENSFDFARAEREYSLAFAAAGLAVEPGRENDLAKRSAESPIRDQLLASLDDWAWTAQIRKQSQLSDRLLAVARLVDPDAWRDQIRDPATRQNKDLLVKLAKEALADPRRLKQLSPEMLQAIGVLLVMNQLEAEEWLRRAQSLHPTDFWINYSLALVLKQRKEKHVEAIGFYRAAVAIRPDSSSAWYNLGNALRGQKDLRGAIAAYQNALASDPKFLNARMNLGGALQDQNDQRGAIDVYREAVAIAPQDAEAWFYLGNALRNHSVALNSYEHLPAAIEAFRKATKYDPNHPEAHCNLGQLLVNLGEFGEALPILKRGHALGIRRPDWTYTSADWVKNCERLVALDKRFSEVEQGASASPIELISLAEMCRRNKQRYHKAAALFGKALAAEPKLGEDPAKLRRYNAARSAALAGCGHGKDADKLDPEERGQLRRQALDWLLADLAAWRLLLEKNKDKAGPPLRTEMRLWLDDTDFASVRGPEALAKLPEAEQRKWQHLWTEVAALRDRAAAKSVPVKQGNK